MTNRLDRRGAVIGLPHNLDIRLGAEDHPHTRAYERLIVGQQHPDTHRSVQRLAAGPLLRGSVAEIVNCPGASTICTLPP